MSFGTYIIIKTQEKHKQLEDPYDTIRLRNFTKHHSKPESPRYKQWIFFSVDLIRNPQEDKEYFSDDMFIVEHYLDQSKKTDRHFLAYEAFFQDFILVAPDNVKVEVTDLVPDSPPEIWNIPSFFVEQNQIVKRYGQIGQNTRVHIENLLEENKA